MIQLNAEPLATDSWPVLRRSSSMVVFSAALVICLLLGCSRDGENPEVEGALVAPAHNTQAPMAKAPDRLPEGELLEGEQEAFGFRVPKEMRMSRTRKIARVVGQVNFNALTDYVKARILARHAEMFGKELTFPQATIRGGSPGAVYKITLIEGVREQVLIIQDETRPIGVQGLDEAERWKRAGLKPNGGLVDPNAMQ